MQFGPLDENIECPVKPLERPRSKQITDIPLCIAIDDDGLLRLQYDSSRFNRRDAMRMGEILKRAILGLLRPDSTMSDVVTSLLSVPMLEQLREYGNCNSALTTRPSIKHDLVTLFEKAAGLVPDSIAIEKGDMVLTYKDLDVAASRVAAGLSSYVDPGEVVCLHADRSIGWIVGIYATLKLGAVYSPMAVDLPKQFRGTQFEAAAAKIFLIPDSSQREHRPSSCEEVNVLSIDDLLRAEATYLTEPRASPRPTDAAYLCFTSGSTGVPKGVLCAHESLVAFQRDLEVRLFAQPGTRVSQIMSAAFDGSIHEIFSALSYGATLVLPDGLEPFDHLSKVHSAILTPSIARVVDPTKYPDLRSVYLVGESVPPTVSNLWARQPGLALYNMFGPTEATCGATIKRLLPDETVTIGPPNPSTRIYIMDREQNLVPPGVIGELYLAGVQVARGYVGQAAQTRERFLADPICRIGEMMYKTGDRGYWTLTGDVMCLGRTDREVKLRGFRLNLNDLEIRITKTDPLIQAVAIAVKDDQLVALLQPETINVAQTKSKIEDALPKHAVPAQILTISRLPMTGAGKIDYKAIPRLFSEQQARPAQGLTTATQRRVANAFRFVLKIEKTCAVSGTSNFTELGGTSLMQVSLSSRLTREFGFQIPLRLVIERDNVLALAEAIDIMRGSKRPELHRCRTLGDQQVSPIEAEWLEKYDLDAGSSSFNVLYVCDFSPEQFDRERLTHTFNTVLKRHPMLRSRYVARRGKKVTRSYASVAPRVQQVQGISVWVEANRPFELHTSDPVRVLISEDKIMLVMSHIIADFTTLSILLSEAAALYKGQKPALPAKSYGECTVWYEDARPCYLEWWRETFSNVPQGPAMLKPGQERRAYRGSSAVFEVAKGLHASMRAYCTSTTVSLQQLAMGAVAASLSCDKQATDIVLGSPYVNRPTEEDRSVIGLFLEPLPVRVKYELECQPTSADGGPATFLQSVRQASQASLAQAIPWHQLLDHLEVEPNFPSHPLFDAVVSYHEVTQMSTLGSLIPGTQPLFVWSEGSKFKLMIEFSEFAEEKLMLRLEHDTDILTELEIGKLHKLLIRALELLVTETSFEDMMEALRAVMDGHDHGDHNDERLDSSTVFGRRIADL